MRWSPTRRGAGGRAARPRRAARRGERQWCSRRAGAPATAPAWPRRARRWRPRPARSWRSNRTASPARRRFAAAAALATGSGWWSARVLDRDVAQELQVLGLLAVGGAGRARGRGAQLGRGCDAVPAPVAAAELAMVALVVVALWPPIELATGVPSSTRRPGGGDAAVAVVGPPPLATAAALATSSARSSRLGARPRCRPGAAGARTARAGRRWRGRTRGGCGGAGREPGTARWWRSAIAGAGRLTTSCLQGRRTHLRQRRVGAPQLQQQQGSKVGVM